MSRRQKLRFSKGVRVGQYASLTGRVGFEVTVLRFLYHSNIVFLAYCSFTSQFFISHMTTYVSAAPLEYVIVIEDWQSSKNSVVYRSVGAENCRNPFSPISRIIEKYYP